MKRVIFYSMVLLGLVACGGGGSTGGAAGGGAGGGGAGGAVNIIPAISTAEKQAYLNAINIARGNAQDCGTQGVYSATTALTWSTELYEAAYEHSQDMAESNTFSHTGSGTATDWTAQAHHPGVGSTMQERIEDAGYKPWQRIGENITAGTVRDTAQKAVDAWLASDLHCANLMNPNYKEVGLAHYEKTGSTYTHYWTQDFGTK